MGRKLYLTLLIVALLAFSSSIWGDTVSTLLEEGIYAEETKGDLDEAIAIYKKIIDENEGNLSNIAKVYYRLGTCYLKTGDDAKAIEMFKQLMTRFPEQVEIVNDAKNQLSKLETLDDGDRPLEIGPAPWEAGETCWYDMKTPANMSLGKMIMSIKSVAINGNDMWRIENYLVIAGENQSQLSRVDVLKNDFMPVSGIVKGLPGNFKVTYQKDHIQLNIDSPDTKGKKEVSINNIIYDNAQVPHLLRRLLIKENYSSTLSIFNPQTGSVMKAGLRTTGLETVEVPAGTFKCYCDELKIDSKTKVKLWYSADENKYLVKMETPQASMELEKIAHVSAEQSEVFNDSEFGISMSAPEGWHIVKSPISAQFKMLVVLLPPEINAWFPFIVTEHSGMIKPDSLRGVAESEVSQLKLTFKNFSVDPASWKAGVIGGLPSISFSADFDDKDKKMVDCRTYILGKSYLYFFLIRTEKEVFENNKQEYFSIIQSLRVDDK